MYFHPLQEEIANMSDEDISKRIKELSKKVAIARRGRNPEMLQNLQLALQTYQDTIRQRRIESWHENRKKLRNEPDLGDLINIEKSLRVGDEISGHFVFGHVDDTAILVSSKKTGGSYELIFKISKNLRQFIVKKGSVAINGISSSFDFNKLNFSKLISFWSPCLCISM